MTIVCSATNAWVGGVRVPVGSYDLPVSGVIGVSTEGWASNTVVVGSGDTLILASAGPEVLGGYGMAESWAVGFAVGLAALSLVGIVRRMTRFLAGGARVSDL